MAFSDYTLNTVINLNAGERVWFRQKAGYSFDSFYSGNSHRYEFLMSGGLSYNGDITKMLDINGITTLGDNGLRRLFYNQTSLYGDFPLINIEVAGQFAFNEVFYGCTNLSSAHFRTLNASSNTFYDCSSCASLTIDAATPPTIRSNTITGLKSDCIIYVPAGSVAAYQADQYWSARAAYIQAIPNT